jgi:hypothetical protein
LSVSLIGWCFFAATYEFPAAAGFSEYPFSAELTRRVLTHDLILAGGSLAVLGLAWTLVHRSREAIRQLTMMTVCFSAYGS